MTSPFSKRLRRTRFQLATLLGMHKRGFFIPHRYADRIEPVAYPALAPWFEAAEPAFLEVIAWIEACLPDLGRIGGAPPPQPRFDQAWFPPLDAMAAYALVRRLRPARIVEVGSGHSTRFLVRAVQDGGLATEIVCIDPAPRAALAGLGVHWLHTLVQDAPSEPFAALRGGDILFVDSSHVLVPGSDVDLILNDRLPRLEPGVLVHLHDIFLPDPYPLSWEWRGYNEQGAVGALVQGGGYELRFASHYVASRMEPKRFGEFDRRGLAPDCSLWLVKR